MNLVTVGGEGLRAGTDIGEGGDFAHVVDKTDEEGRGGGSTGDGVDILIICFVPDGDDAADDAAVEGVDFGSDLRPDFCSLGDRVV